MRDCDILILHFAVLEIFDWHNNVFFFVVVAVVFVEVVTEVVNHKGT